MRRATSTLILLALILFPFTVFAKTEGIPLQKDVYLGSPIYGPEDLPEEITFTLYGSKDGLSPLASQTFPRGQYSVDFEFSKSDGITSGNIARVSVNFTQKLKITDIEGEASEAKEIWAGLAVDGAEIGDRTKVSDEALVQLLLASDATVGTFLTLAYEGDDNPIASIYKNLPISLLSCGKSTGFLETCFGTVVTGSNADGSLNRVAGTDGQIQYNDGGTQAGAAQFYYDDKNGRVGIGTDSPTMDLDLRGKLYIASSQPQLFLDDTSGSTGSWSINNYNGALNFDNPGIGWKNRKVIFKGNGNVGIGTNKPTYELSVNGTIRCKQLIVDTGWSDFVFKDDYKIPTLSEVDQFIKQNGHLPNIPSEAEVNKNGISVGEISSKLLQKIEELTLYVIDLKKENDILKERIARIEEAKD